MSLEVESYEDPILALARDPDLNREKGKTSKIILLIQGFPIVERKVSRLCQLSLTILQTLEKIELNLKNWAFMSLDLNSANHFDSGNTNEIRNFNSNVSFKVIESCRELTQKLNKITADLDFITAALRSLSPIEFISDSGTLLTSLTLRNIKLKDDLRDKVTVAYSKAKLITIGTDLEAMLVNGDDDQRATVESYKQFVVSLLAQLSDAVEQNDIEQRNECLAVINDMEQMFEVYKAEREAERAELERSHALERAQEAQKSQDSQTSQTSQSSAGLQSSKLHESLKVHSETRSHTENLNTAHQKYALVGPTDYSDEYESSDDFSMSHSTATLYIQPTVHSITKHGEAGPESARRGSITSFASASILQKSTITEELPYLMSAFNLAREIEEDLHHYKEEDPQGKEKRTTKQKQSKMENVKELPKEMARPHLPKNLPQTPLFSESQILHQPVLSPGAYLYANNSLLLKFGIKPQVITAELPKHLTESAVFNRNPQLASPDSPSYFGSKLLSGKKEDKENKTLLTRENLESHNLKSLMADTQLALDYVE